MRPSPTAVAPSPRETAAKAPSLAVAGGLALLALFLVENAWFGTHARRWPWDTFLGIDLDLAGAIVRALWAAVALSALLLAFCPAGRVRAAVLAVLLAALLIASVDASSPFALATGAVQRLLPLIALGAGLWLAGSARTRGAGRLLALVGALTFVWHLAALFLHGAGGDTENSLCLWWQDLVAATGDPAGALDDPEHLWWGLLPQTLTLLACAFGLLAAAGLTGRVFLRMGVVVLLVSLLVPRGASASIDLRGGFTLEQIPGQLATIAYGQGFLLWLLGVLAVVDGNRLGRRAA